ncbi:MAG: murein L,D-transpeptidase catalytic domain family protein [Pseudomonadota bacterium]
MLHRLLLVFCCWAEMADAQAGISPERLQAAAPDADPVVLRHALDAMRCANVGGMPASQRLAVIDYSRPSTEPRLWVFDLDSGALLFRELVAHGRNSGESRAQHFSNEIDSRTSSLGLFRTDDTYVGSNGYSLRLDGLEPGINDRARARAIVMHGADYVTEEHAKKFGRLGRSWGCPAVRQGVARQLIDTLKGGQFIFSYYPDRDWLASSRYLNCGQQTASR